MWRDVQQLRDALTQAPGPSHSLVHVTIEGMRDQDIEQWITRTLELTTQTLETVAVLRGDQPWRRHHASHRKENEP